MMSKLRAVVEDPRFERLVIVLILVNAVVLGLETSRSTAAAVGPLLTFLDSAILAFFVVEIAARIAVRGRAFFKDPWSLFDLFVVAIALVPATDALQILRALRVLRLLRLVTAVPALRRVVGGLIAALPGMASIGLLLGLIFYVFAVIGTRLYGESNPELFGSLGDSAYTLFQAMTFDDWSNGIVKPLTEKGNIGAWFYVMAFMVISAFMALNLFIGVVVTALDAETGEEGPKLTHPAGAEGELLARIDALAAEVQALRTAIAGQPPGR